MSNKLKSIKTTRKVILKVTRTYKTGKFAYTTKKKRECLEIYCSRKCHFNT